MLLQTLLAFSISSLTLTHAAPHVALLPRNTSAAPAIIGVSYYQGSECGQYLVASGSMALNVCSKLGTASIGIDTLPDHGCTFKMWQGASDCGVSGAGGVVESTHAVAAAEGESVCVMTGVLDGGKFIKASGMWTC